MMTRELVKCWERAVLHLDDDADASVVAVRSSWKNWRNTSSCPRIWVIVSSRGRSSSACTSPIVRTNRFQMRFVVRACVVVEPWTHLAAPVCVLGRMSQFAAVGSFGWTRVLFTRVWLNNGGRIHFKVASTVGRRGRGVRSSFELCKSQSGSLFVNKRLKSAHARI